MRISDEKRREIAASLRESRQFISCLPKSSLEQNAFDTFERILACVDYERGNIFDYLADLIDRPTCRICATDHEYEDSVRCDRCRMTFRRPWEPFKYCPNCGAEVKDDAEPNLKEN